MGLYATRRGCLRTNVTFITLLFYILPYTDEYSGVPLALNLVISDVHRYDNGAGSTERV